MATKRAKKKASLIEGEAPERRALHYKVVELSSVDEHTVERTLNEWVPMGWKFDGLQFAMRESSKRPSMAFVFFTREGAPLPQPEIVPHLEVEPRGEAEALAHLQRLTAEVDPMQTAWERLHGLAASSDKSDKGDKPEPEET